MATIKQLRITKVDGSVHFAPASALNMKELPLQNMAAPGKDRSKIELVEFDDSEIADPKNITVVEVIAEGSVVIDALAIQAASADKDARIAELEALLAASKTGGSADKPSTAAEVIHKINSAISVDEVNELSNGDTRKTVVDAAAARIAELSK